MSLEVFHLYQWLLGCFLVFSSVVSHQRGLLPLLLTDLNPDTVMYLQNNSSVASPCNQQQTWATCESYVSVVRRCVATLHQGEEATLRSHFWLYCSWNRLKLHVIARDDKQRQYSLWQSILVQVNKHAKSDTKEGSRPSVVLQVYFNDIWLCWIRNMV